MVLLVLLLAFSSVTLSYSYKNLFSNSFYFLETWFHLFGSVSLISNLFIQKNKKGIQTIVVFGFDLEVSVWGKAKKNVFQFDP